MARAAHSAPVQRKNFYLRVDTLKRAQQVLGARTETAAVERALELAMFQQDALKAFRQLCKQGEIEDVFGHDRRSSAP